MYARDFIFSLRFFFTRNIFNIRRSILLWNNIPARTLMSCPFYVLSVNHFAFAFHGDFSTFCLPKLNDKYLRNFKEKTVIKFCTRTNIYRILLNTFCMQWNYSKMAKKSVLLIKLRYTWFVVALMQINLSGMLFKRYFWNILLNNVGNVFIYILGHFNWITNQYCGSERSVFQHRSHQLSIVSTTYSVSA